MSEEKKDKTQEPKRILTDEQIVTERAFGRRSFLSVVGTAVAGGAAALALGDALEARGARQDDPDKKTSDADGRDPKKRSDPDSKKSGDPDKKAGDAKKRPDPDSRKRDDSDSRDAKKSGDPDKKKPSDPDQR